MVRKWCDKFCEPLKGWIQKKKKNADVDVHRNYPRHPSMRANLLHWHSPRNASPPSITLLQARTDAKPQKRECSPSRLNLIGRVWELLGNACVRSPAERTGRRKVDHPSWAPWILATRNGFNVWRVLLLFGPLDKLQLKPARPVWPLPRVDSICFLRDFPQTSSTALTPMSWTWLRSADWKSFSALKHFYSPFEERLSWAVRLIWKHPRLFPSHAWR